MHVKSCNLMQADPNPCRALLSTAMEMYGLQRFEVFHEELLQTRVGLSA